jgi:uncharacterized protein YkwD
MKLITTKSMKLGLVVAALLIGGYQVTPLISQVLAPPVAPRPAAVVPPPGVNYLPQVEELIFAMTNQARRARGLPPLIKDAELANVARAFSNDMLARRFFDHTTPDGVPFDERISNHYHHWVRAVGENIWSAFDYYATNPRKIAQEIVNDWMSSPGHRENLLDPDFTHLGVGVSIRHHTLRATQEFVGQPQAFRFGRLFTPAR